MVHECFVKVLLIFADLNFLGNLDQFTKRPQITMSTHTSTTHSTAALLKVPFERLKAPFEAPIRTKTQQSIQRRMGRQQASFSRWRV